LGKTLERRGNLLREEVFPLLSKPLRPFQEALKNIFIEKGAPI